jgi:hypothetical protein
MGLVSYAGRRDLNKNEGGIYAKAIIAKYYTHLHLGT